MQLRAIEDLDPLEELSLINMSYSRLDMYSTCAAKYYYTYILKEPRVFGPAASLGSILHSVLEDVVGEPLVLDNMLELMTEHREKHDPEHLIDDDLWVAGRGILTEFYDNHEGEKLEIVGKELPFALLIGSAKVIGYIDLVTKHKDEYILVTDYKSGKWEVAAKNIPENLQIGLYALACAQLFPDMPIKAELYYLRSGKRKGHLFKPEDLEDVYARSLEQVQTMINDRHFKTTQNPRPCYYCDFAISKACSTGAARLKKKPW